MDNIQEFFDNNTKKIIASAIVFVVIFILIFVLRYVVARFSKKQHNKRIITISKLTQSIIRYLLAIILIIALLGILGVDVKPLLAGAGVIGIIIGFGAQSLIKDLLAGISIVFDNYYDIDDIVEIKGFKGRVIEVGLKSTRIQDWKGQVKIIANGEITEIINFSKNPSIGVVEFEVAYNENIDKILNILDEKILNVKDMFPQIVEGPNIVGVTKLASGGVTIRITVKTISEQHYAVERGIYKFIKELFEEYNIEIPYQRMVIYDQQSNNKLS